MFKARYVPFTERLKAYMELMRTHNLVNSAFAAIAGYIVSYGTFKGQISYDNLLLGVAIVVLVAAGGYVINDYFDVEVDKVNKPYRPIPSGRVSPTSAYRLAITLFFIAFLLSLVLIMKDYIVGTFASAFAIFHIVLLYYYSKRLKEYGLLGNIVVSFSSFSSILYGGIVYSIGKYSLEHVCPSLIPALYAFLIILGREIVKGIEDVEGDKVRNVKTLAILYGAKRALHYATIPILLVIILSPLPSLTPLLAKRYGLMYLLTAIIGVDLPAIYALYRLYRNIEFASKARSILKFSLFMGPIAFIIGAVLE